METLMQFMVIKKNGTTTLIAEIGTIKDFSSGDKLLHGVSSSKCIPICRYIRQFLNHKKRIKDINVDSKAYCSVSSKKKNQIKRVFYRKKKSIGHSKAIIAPTKKISTII